MAWDDTKIANDDFLSADWNNMVADQKGRSRVYDGLVTPIGAITPEAVGDLYIDTVLSNAYVATGTTSADWELIDTAVVSWGAVTGTLSNQTDLQDELDLKYASADYNTDWDARLATKDTGDLSEATDKNYVTDAEAVVIGNTSNTNSGDQTITLTNDVTGTGTGSFAATIANDAVTYAKIQNVVNDERILGRVSGANGIVEELTKAQVLTMINVEDGAEANNISDVNATDLTDAGDSSLHYHSTDRARANHTGTQVASTISDFDTEVANNSAVSLNTAKLTNATHTGEVTGDGALTVDKTAITGQSLVTAVSTDYVMISDTSDTGNLKKALVSDFGGGYTNLTEFVDQTAYRIFYSNSSGDVTELAFGASGTFLKSNGASAAPTFATPSGSGDVSKDGTPVDNQVGVWTGDGTIEGTSGLTYDGSTFYVSGNITLSGTVDGIDIATDVAANTLKVSYDSTSSTKVGFISVTQVVDLDTMESNIATNNDKISYSSAASDAVALNTAKETNYSHTGDATGDTALTLATVNSNVGSFTNANITVNAKGLVTAAANGSGGSGGITWNEVTSGSQSASVDNGYIANYGTLVTITLPDTAALGSIVRVAGKGAGGWKVAQNASEQIIFGNQSTTTGTSGSLASVNDYDSVELLCITANTTWVVISSIGNITVV